MRAHLGWDGEGEFFETLRQTLGSAVELTASAEPPEPADYNWLVSGVPSRELVEASAGLEGLIIPWAGLPLRTAELMAEFPRVAIHNLHHNAAATAEMAVGLMISAAKQIVPADRSLRQGDWSFRYADWSAPLLEGKTAVIVGYGSIGRRVGAVCQALGMAVIGVRRGSAEGASNPTLVEGRPRPGDSVTVSADSLNDVLPRADVLVVAVPATQETQSLFDASRLERLPDRAIVVNVARGAVIDEEALYDGLQSGRIGAAGIDVWYRYPQSTEERDATFPAERPFHELESVVMSPHRAGHTKETEGQRAQAVADLLLEAAAGRSVPNRVRLERGY